MAVPSAWPLTFDHPSLCPLCTSISLFVEVDKRNQIDFFDGTMEIFRGYGLLCEILLEETHDNKIVLEHFWMAWAAESLATLHMLCAAHSRQEQATVTLGDRKQPITSCRSSVTCLKSHGISIPQVQSCFCTLTLLYFPQSVHGSSFICLPLNWVSPTKV